MPIGLGEDMTPIDFEQKMKTWFPLIILRTFCYRASIFYMMIGLDGDMTPVDTEIIRLRSEGSHF